MVDTYTLCEIKMDIKYNHNDATNTGHKMSNKKQMTRLRTDP